MAGILDKKTRFMDTLLTDLGRQQLAKGELQFSFATFSDMSTFYERSAEDPTVSEDSTDRIMFEPFSRQQDLIIPEFDADGGLFFPAGDFNIADGRLVSVSGSRGVVSGSELDLSFSTALSNCLESLQELQPLRTRDPVTRESGFRLSSNSATFVVNDEGPIPLNAQKEKRLSNVESLWQDKKLSHVDNFKFLPPVNKGTNKALFEYSKLEQPEPMNYRQIEDDLGVGTPWRVPRVADLEFPLTSLDNNLVCQVWEVTSEKLNKLRIIDFGEFEDEDPFSPGKHVFYIGKLQEDDAGQNTFLNIFTVVFD